MLFYRHFITQSQLLLKISKALHPCDKGRHRFRNSDGFWTGPFISVVVLLAIPISFSRHESVRSILSAPIPYKTCASISRKYPQACYLRQHLVNPSQATWKVQTFEKQSKKKFAYKNVSCFHDCWLCAWSGSVLFYCKRRIFHTCHLHDYSNITQCRGTKFLRRYLRLHTKPPLYTHKTWYIHKIFSFYAKHSTYKDSSITFLLNRNLLPQRKPKQKCEIGLDATYLSWR